MKWLPANLKGILGIITIILVFGYFYGITFFEIKLDKDIVLALIVGITAFGKDIYNYFFGNTQGAAKKDELIANMQAPPVAQTTTGDINVNKNTTEMPEFKVEEEVKKDLL